MKSFENYISKAKVTKINWLKPKSSKSGQQGEVTITSQDGRFVIIKQLTYGGNFTYRLVDKKFPSGENNWNNLPSLKDAKDQALEYV